MRRFTEGVLVHLATHQFSRSWDKLQEILQHARLVPGSEQKFAGLQELIGACSKSPESKLINCLHFTPGLREKMATDADFIRALVVNLSRLKNKAINILDGISFA